MTTNFSIQLGIALFFVRPANKPNKCISRVKTGTRFMRNSAGCIPLQKTDNCFTANALYLNEFNNITNLIHINKLK